MVYLSNKCNYCDQVAIAYNPFSGKVICSKHYQEDLFELEQVLYYK